MINDIGRLRIKKNMTSRELSRLSKIPKTTLQRMENGETIPGIDSVVKIARALEIDPSRLFSILIEGEEY